MTAQHWFWGAAALLLALAVFAAVAEARRHNRTDLDRIGWVPWRGIQVAAAFALLVDLVLALKLG